MPADTEKNQTTSKNAFLIPLLIIFVFACFRGYLLTQQPGTYLDDEIGHFIISRDAWKHFEFIFSFWGRPGCTLFFMPGALFSLEAARVTALLSVSLTSYLLVLISKELGLKRLWLAPLLFETQPWILNYSSYALTQPPALLALTAGMYFYLRKNYLTSSLILGWLPLIRHETIVLNAFFGFVLLLQKRFGAMISMAVPGAIICLLCYFLYDVNFLSPFFTPEGTDIYGKGTWLTYIMHLLKIENAHIAATVLSLLAFPLMLKNRLRLVVYLPFIILLLTHTIIYKFGLYSSGGFGIFLLPIAPIMAFAAATLVEAIKEKIPPFASIASNVLVVLICLYPVTQIKMQRPLNGESKMMKEVTEWVRENRTGNERIISTNTWTYYWLPYTTPHEDGAWFKALWSKNFQSVAKKGDLLIWDAHYSERWGNNLEALNASPDWERIYELEKTKFAVVFRRK